MSEVKLAFLPISVVIPLYNKELYVGECINSILNQLYPPDEIIIVNDGSTDKSLDVVNNSLKGYRGKFVLIDQRNAGVSYARNAGIKASSNGYVALIDADDLWHPLHLFLLSELILKRPGGVIYSSAYRAHSKNLIFSGIGNGIKFTTFDNDDIHECYLSIKDHYKFGIHSSSVCVHKETAVRIGGFSDISIGEDIEFWVRLSVSGKSFMHSYITALYRLGVENSLSSGVLNPLSNNGNYVPTAVMQFLAGYIENAEGSSDSCDLKESARSFLKNRLFIGFKILIFKGKVKQLYVYKNTVFFRKYGPSNLEIVGLLYEMLIKNVIRFVSKK